MLRTATIPIRQAVEDPLDLKRLFEEHGDFVRSLLCRLLGPGGDADDLTQEVFLVALRRLPSLDVDSPRSWLAQIAVKLAATARRRIWFRRVLGLEEAGELVERRTPELMAEAREATRNVYRALEKMSEKKRTVFILFEIQGMSGQEIADAIGCPLQTVHTRLWHARREFLAHYDSQTAPAGRQGGCGE